MSSIKHSDITNHHNAGSNYFRKYLQYAAAVSIGDFVDAHPSIKILALSFLIMVGAMLIVEGFDVHVPKGYIYFAMAFSVAVEMINIRMRKGRNVVKLHKAMSDEKAD